MGSTCQKQPAVTNAVIKKQIDEYSKNTDFKKKYEYVSILGNGSFGKVRLYSDRNYKGMYYAIKTLRKDRLSKAIYDCLIAEVNILRNLDHPNIVKYYETFEDNVYLHIVMEYLSGDDLYKVIAYNHYATFDEKDMCFIMKQIIKALIFIHSKGIVHRDIKPENILFGKKDDFATLKLIDFGLATTLDKKDKKSVGSPYYMAPEIINSKYSTKTDLWSVGVLLHLMVSGKFPFLEGVNNDVFYNICYEEFDGKNLEKAPCSDEAKDLIMKLLVKDPLKRLSSEETMNHPWFIKYSSLQHKVILNNDTIQTLKDFSNKTALQKEILFFIAKISKDEEISKLRDLFNELDTDNTGSLTIEEIRIAFNRIGLKITEDDIKKIWNGLDFHKDGEINYTEFIAAMISSFNFSKEEKLWSAFQYFETASDSGFISSDSLLKATKAFNLQVNEQAIVKGFEQLKTKNKKLDFNGFKQLITEKMDL